MEFAIQVKDGQDSGRPLVCLQTNRAIPPKTRDSYDLVLEPYGYRWFRLGGLEDMIVDGGPVAHASGTDADS